MEVVSLFSRSSAPTRLLIGALLFACVDALSCVGDRVVVGDLLWIFAYSFGLAAVGLLLLWSLVSVAMRIWAQSEEQLAFFLGVLTAGCAAWIGWQLTAGRMVQATWWRLPAVTLLSMTAAILSVRVFRYTLRRLGQGAWLTVLALGGLVLCVALDALVTQRSYPVFHGAMLLGGLVFASGASWTMPLRPRSLLLSGLLVAATVIGTGVVIPRLLMTQRGYAIEQTSSFLGFILPTLHASSTTRQLVSGPRVRRRSAEASGLKLAKGTSFLLITVDALRADSVKTDMPFLHDLSQRGVSFERAYTPTPTTSYALSSLLTGTYYRSMRRASTSLSKETIADRFSRFGYQTVALYPPAIFYVDAEAFTHLAEHSFGFSRTFVDHADATKRVDLALAELKEQSPDRSLFYWVHLFEPHEPYEPPAAYRDGDSPKARYRGELRYVDTQIRRLVEGFRKARPSSWVVVTADHGEEFGEHGGAYHGTTLFDEQVRVPMIWQGEGITRSTRREAVDLVDVAPSLLGLARIPAPLGWLGQDLSAMMQGREFRRSYAYSEVRDERMVADERFKLWCRLGTQCRLFDLKRDPHELSPADDNAEQRLSKEMQSVLSRIAGVHAESDAEECLSRGRLGDRTVAPELIRLLGSPDPAQRGEAATLLGHLEATEAAAVLKRVVSLDEDKEVSLRALIASAELGESSALRQVETRLTSLGKITHQRLAALALIKHRRTGSIRTVCDWLGDESESDAMRKTLIELLSHLDDPRVTPCISQLLPHLGLRIAAVEALGRSGDAAAVDPIVSLLEAEPYPQARLAEVHALANLGKGKLAKRWVRHFLTTAVGLPEGVALHFELGIRGKRDGVDFRTTKAHRRYPNADCSVSGCRFEKPTQITPAAKVTHAVFWLDSVGSLRINGEVQQLSGEQYAVAVEGPFTFSGDSRIAAIALVYSTM